jgi:hypothetical protein
MSARVLIGGYCTGSPVARVEQVGREVRVAEAEHVVQRAGQGGGVLAHPALDALNGTGVCG